MEGGWESGGNLQVIGSLDCESNSVHAFPTLTIHLQLLKVVGAGHMVPYDKPKEALTMLNSWLAAATPGN